MFGWIWFGRSARAVLSLSSRHSLSVCRSVGRSVGRLVYLSFYHSIAHPGFSVFLTVIESKERERAKSGNMEFLACVIMVQAHRAHIVNCVPDAFCGFCIRLCHSILQLRLAFPSELYFETFRNFCAICSQRNTTIFTCHLIGNDPTQSTTHTHTHINEPPRTHL